MPSDEDLDYPAKLEQSVEKKSETSDVMFLTLPHFLAYTTKYVTLILMLLGKDSFV